jgi:hypothetical protein
MQKEGDGGWLQHEHWIPILACVCASVHLRIRCHVHAIQPISIAGSCRSVVDPISPNHPAIHVLIFISLYRDDCHHDHQVHRSGEKEKMLGL